MGNQHSNGEGLSLGNGHGHNIFGSHHHQNGGSSSNNNDNNNNNNSANRAARHNPFGGLEVARKTLAQAMQDNLRTGTLGLSKAELDKRCQPSGLYDSCFWDDRTIRRLIGDGKLAARLKGTDERTSPIDQECPICFLYYSEINVSKCCSATICSECYLQVRPQNKPKQRPDHTITACASGCPFCNSPKLYVSVAKPLKDEQIQQREIEEQRLLEAQIKARAAGICSSGDLNSTSDTTESDDSIDSGGSKVFGSSLERHSKFLMQARSESNASSSFSGGDAPSTPHDSVISQIAMTPEERRALEAEMRAQLSHPLALRLEAEAAERQLEHDRAYMATAPAPSSRSSRRRGRDWNRIIDAFERGGNGQVHVIDDLVVLEAAILLSAEEEARRGERQSRTQLQQSGDTERNGDGNYEGQSTPGRSSFTSTSAAATPTSGANSNNDGGSNEDGADRSGFDIARHAREGFPLMQSFLASRFNNSNTGGDGENERSGGNVSINNRAELDDAIERALNNPLIRNLAQSINRGRSRLLQQNRRPPTATLDAASLVLRGMSEEQQLEMAIAASLRDQQQQQQQGVSSEGDEENATPVVGTENAQDEGEQGRNIASIGNDLEEENIEGTSGGMPAVAEESSENVLLGLEGGDEDLATGMAAGQNLHSDLEVEQLLREAAELMEEPSGDESATPVGGAEDIDESDTSGPDQEDSKPVAAFANAVSSD